MIKFRPGAFWLLIAVSQMSFTAMYGKNVKGTVVDAKDSTSLPGANVYVTGTSQGTVTNLDGTFSFSIPDKAESLTLSFVGYQSRMIATTGSGDLDLGKIAMQSDAVALAEVSISASIAKDRVTPIAVSNIKPQYIAEKLGTQEFVEILKTSPGIYATKRGGGYGDSDVRIRGFGNNNVAVMINGMPVNGMEDDKVYWSNWAGLADVTRMMQVQRGVGASKIAVPSVGGTINVITKTTDAKAGGSVFYNEGNDGYHKYGVTVSSGLSKNNFAATFSLSHTKGNGYVEGTPFQGYSYFMSLSKKINDKHQLALTVFGAPQTHAQRYNYQDVSILKTRPNGHRYNEDWGYMNGQFYTNDRNFYHKPVVILNHYWNYDENTFISTAAYASVGIGGGGYGVFSETALTYGADNQIAWDTIVAKNKARSDQGLSTGSYFQNSYNHHAWYGILSSVTKKMGALNFMAGLDLRYYYGKHWQQADDLLGGSYLTDKKNKDAIYFYNNQVGKGGKIYYNNDGEVAWEGLFVQAEYSKEQLSAFVSGSVSNRSYRRYDFAQYFTDDLKNQLKNDVSLQNEWENKLQDYMTAHGYSSILESKAYTQNQVSEWVSFLGYSLKAGANYNFTEQHNVFVNAGYMVRQPIFSIVFENYQNQVNKKAKPEKVNSFEVGYGFRSRYISANTNVYYTLWKDRTTSGSINDPLAQGEKLYYQILGVDALHRGIELDLVVKPQSSLEITGMVSIGDWVWNNDPGKTYVTKEQSVVDTINGLYIKGVHVADAAQTTAALGINYELLPGLKLGMDVVYCDRLYSQFTVENRTEASKAGMDSEKLPAYCLVDLNMYYRFKLGNYDAALNGNMHNVFNTMYIADAKEGYGYYFGFGRTCSVGLKMYF